MLVLFLLVSDPLDRQYIDIVFAVSASSSEAEDTMQLMKAALQSIVSTHGTKNIHYSVISYGAQIRRIVSFQDTFPDDQALIQKLDDMSAVPGTPNLVLSLAEAKSAFEGPGARPNAKKFLVIIADNESGSTKDDILKSALVLEVSGVKVIPIVIGNNVKREELEKVTPYKENIIAVSTKVIPENLGKKIIDKVRESKY